MQTITPNLWFNNQAEKAVNFYTSIFKNSKIGAITYFTEAGKNVHGQKPGRVMTIEFEINGQPFLALNGGPRFKFNEAVSFIVPCDSQSEIDEYWNKLTEGGDKAAQQCGWLKDKYGVSWQIVPAEMGELLKDQARAEIVIGRLMKMTKIDWEQLKAT